MENQQTEPTILTVSQLNGFARDVLEECFASVMIEGEISNFSKPSSGHMYFTLKDDAAQVRCAMFRGNNMKLQFKPEHGMQVTVKARVSLYVGRGDFQLIVSSMEEAGDGALQRAFEQLKKKLHAQGLFAQENKKSLPLLPRAIGVVTSATGAALHDILSVLQRRFASIPVIVYPTPVQGELAAQKIVNAISKANELKQCDVLLVARGGGSLEDLWPFNEEIVAHAVFSSDIPIVSGVGHEVDFTICDFVADQRAPTPTAAAELVSPDKLEWQHKIDQLRLRLTHHIHTIIQQAKMQLAHLQKRIRHPGQKLQQQSQQLDMLEQRLITSMHNLFENKNLQLQSVVRALNAVSPLNTLSRGFAIASKNNKIITDAKQVNIDDQIDVRLHSGNLTCTVKEHIE